METLILNARNSIYDEELQHELHREARNDVSHGIRCIDGKITMPYEGEKHIEIDLLSSTDNDACFSNYEGKSDKRVADSIAISLRILLSHAHRQNLHRRSQLPPRITENKTPRPLHAILRPILENLQHHSKLKSLVVFLNRVAQTLSSAGLSLNVGEPTLPYNLKTFFSAPSNQPISAMEALVNAVILPLQSSVTIHLPSTFTTIKIEVHTSLQAPFAGTSFQSSILSSAPGSIIATMPPLMRPSRVTDLEAHIMHLVQLDILGFLASNPDAGSGWTIASPHAGLMSRTNKKTGTSDCVYVGLEKESLHTEWQRRGQGLNLSRKRKWGFMEEESIEKGDNKGLLATIGEAFHD